MVTTKLRYRYAKAFFQRTKSRYIEISRLKKHDIKIPRPKSYDIKSLWNSDCYAPPMAEIHNPPWCSRYDPVLRQCSMFDLFLCFPGPLVSV